MQTRIDSAGRLVIPKELRDRIGMGPGQVEVYVEGAAIKVEPTAIEEQIDTTGRFAVLAGRNAEIDDDVVRQLRDADRR